jgi:hypothetical protein
VAYVITATVTAESGTSAMVDFWPLWPLLAVAFALIMLTARWSERAVRFQLHGLRAGLAVIVVVFAGFSLTRLHNDHQRCVDKQTMTVAAAADCQNAGSQVGGGRGTYVWYYGGKGTQIGDSVQDGTLHPPAEDGGGGGDGDG